LLSTVPSPQEALAAISRAESPNETRTETPIDLFL
jgi:hypothetical protein